MKRFIVLTTGRSGSTSLIKALEAYQDVIVPNKQIRCFDNELLNPSVVKEHVSIYQKLASKRIENDVDLSRVFFESVRTGNYVGYKSNPSTHSDIPRLISELDVQFINLYRLDVPATIASYLVAKKFNTWRRSGEKQQIIVNYSDRLNPDILHFVNAISLNHHKMSKVRGAIELHYEDLCNPDHENPRLNNFFGRQIKISEPKPPIHVSEYVRNWEEFSEFINSSYRERRNGYRQGLDRS